MEWLQWLTGLVKLIGDLIPQREKIAETHRGVKFKCMKRAIVLRPGCHWYWPWRSEILTIAVKRQVLHLAEQTLTTADKVAVKIQGIVTYEIGDTDAEILRALVDCWEVADQIDDEATATFCQYITTTTFDEIQSNRRQVNAQITGRVRTRLAEYGVRVKRAQLTTLATGFPVLIVGNNGA